MSLETGMILNIPSLLHHCKHIGCSHLRNEYVAWHFSKLSPSICFQANATKLVQQICEEQSIRYLVPVDEDSTDPPTVNYNKICQATFYIYILHGDLYLK